MIALQLMASSEGVGGPHILSEELLAAIQGSTPKPDALVALDSNTDKVQHTESMLRDEWKWQAAVNAELYAAPLGVSRERYILGLPQFPIPPHDFDEGVHTPLIVQVPVPGKLDLEKMLARAGVMSRLPVDGIVDLRSDVRKFRTPIVTYTTWSIRREVTEQEPVGAQYRLIPSVRGATVYDGLAFHIRNRETIKKSPIYLLGSVNSGKTPFLRNVEGRTWLDEGWIENAVPGSTVLTAERLLIRGGPALRSPAHRL